MDISTLFDVKGKVVLVTGGGRGIGRMISEGFVRNGARVYIASRDGAACERAAEELNAMAAASSSPGSAAALAADLSSRAECERLAAALAAREDRLHVLVNNSGASWSEGYDGYPDDAWTRVLTLNLQRVFTLTQALTPLLEKAGAGAGAGDEGDDRGGAGRRDPARVVHIGSIDALRVPSYPNLAYSAAKAGLHQLSRVLAAELGPRGVTSNVLACGPFLTRMTEHVLGAPEQREGAAGVVPVGRIGSPEDVAGACLFLCSRAGAFVNGATIRLDGGLSLLSKV